MDQITTTPTEDTTYTPEPDPPHEESGDIICSIDEQLYPVGKQPSNCNDYPVDVPQATNVGVMPETGSVTAETAAVASGFVALGIIAVAVSNVLKRQFKSRS